MNDSILKKKIKLIIFMIKIEHDIWTNQEVICGNKNRLKVNN